METQKGVRRNRTLQGGGPQGTMEIPEDWNASRTEVQKKPKKCNPRKLEPLNDEGSKRTHGDPRNGIPEK